MCGRILLLGLLVFASGKGYADMSYEDVSYDAYVSCLDPTVGCPNYSKSDKSYEDSENYFSEEIPRHCDPTIFNCSEDGEWTSWSQIGRCSATCGTEGLQSRVRSCKRGRGKPCIGSSSDQIPCNRDICPGTGRAPGGGYQPAGAPGGFLGAWAQPGVPAQPYTGTAGAPGFGYLAVGAPGGFLGDGTPPAAPGNFPGGIFGVAPDGMPGVVPSGAPAPPVDPQVNVWFQAMFQAMDQDNSECIDFKEFGQALANGMGHFSVNRPEGNAANTRNWRRK